MNIMNAETIPTTLVPSPTSPVGGTNSVLLTITVDTAPTANTTVQIDCGDPSLLVSPSSSWPYQAPVAANATTATITLGTTSVTSATSVQLRGGAAGADMTDPSDWTATVSISLASQPSPD
ncbi:MAG: hypothetical protein JWL77_4853 [Chthonomonadaceae bacterium]|jgi:hypothetical protein|nr:hypothetical protein [Chthonomonadaceae bacterium]